MTTRIAKHRARWGIRSGALLAVALGLAPVLAMAQGGAPVEAEAWGVSLNSVATLSGTQYVGGCSGCALPLAAGPTPVAFYAGSTPTAAGQNLANLTSEPNSLTVPGVVTVGLLEQLAEGSVPNGTAHGDSDTVGVNVLNGAVTADVLHAVAHAYGSTDPGVGSDGKPGAACEIYKGSDGVARLDSIGSSVAGLAINGTRVALDGSQSFCPKQVPGAALEASLLAPGGQPTGLTVRIYEVLPDRDGNGVQVNMIHVTGNVALSAGDVVSVDLIVGHAHAAVVLDHTQTGGPLSLHKEVAPAQTAAGTVVTYRVNITNQSANQCSVESITDQLSPRYFKFTAKGTGASNQLGVAPAKDFETAGFTASTGTTSVGSDSANTTTWTNGSEYGLAPGKNLSETFEVSVDPKTPSGVYGNLLQVYAPLCGASASTVLVTSTDSSSTGENLGAPLVVGPVAAPTPLPTPSPAITPIAVVQAVSTQLPNTQGELPPLTPLLPLAMAAPAGVALRRLLASGKKRRA
ncbi:MAG: choice-of-anchor P family protein [Candidatus Dormibacteria bacterium]